MNDNLVSISQFSNYVKNIFDAETLLQNISLYGEVSSFNVSGGFAYFTIKDENALLNCIMFNVKEKLNIGDMVIVKGSPNYYVKGGRFSFNVVSVMPYGKGVLYENFLKLKQKLEDLGYFDIVNKKHVPERVKRIGVVTSFTGAVIQDIIDVTKRRNNGVDIVLYPVKVQGIGAESEIANGINFFSEYEKVDCVIVARGGGSLEDLQPFNTEIVAEAVYKCKKPIISAVGHETDFTICDFCSDLRAPTPSAAAELVVNEKRVDVELMQNLKNSFYIEMFQKYKDYKSKLYNVITNINKEIKIILNMNTMKIKSIMQNYIYNIERLISNTTNIIKNYSNRIQLLNPINLIEKGYSKVKINSLPLKSVSQIKIGDEILVELKDGIVDTKTIGIRGN